jgi:hypothetical protein
LGSQTRDCAIEVGKIEHPADVDNLLHRAGIDEELLLCVAKAAYTLTPNEPEPPFQHRSDCPEAFEDGQGPGLGLYSVI